MKALKWILISLGVLIVLIFVFYAEEDWRGKNAWENCRQEFAAKGQSLDWNDYIPPPVPDDQNFFQVTNMQKWFVGIEYPDTNELFLQLNDKRYARFTGSAGADKNLINSTNLAKDYLAWSDQSKPDFDLIRAALKRRYMRMYGSYSKPVIIPLPNIVNIRLVAQILSQRSYCYLLLNQPDDALRELTMLHDSRRISEGAPPGKPMTLVAAMIDVAVTGVYARSIADGLKFHEWREPQLVILQQQLGQVNLSLIVNDAFKYEMASDSRLFENLLKNYRNDSSSSIDWMPKGWVYQNIVTVVRLYSRQLEGIDFTNDIIFPRTSDAASEDVEKALEHDSPYYFFAEIIVPNVTKAIHVLAYNQSLVDEAQIACALERYRLAHGDYPETLDALVPQYMQIIPHDLIGGQPLHYRRTDDGKFLLYSVGWNEADDGGKPSPRSENGGIDYTNGDWVWPVMAK